ncbi:type II toxin-antitoxin system MqsR family toxin, partial [Clostridioides difficile]
MTGGAALGFDFAGIIGVVASLTPSDFYKSMTTHADHRVWQDVY